MCKPNEAVGRRSIEEHLEAWIREPHVKNGECACSVCDLALRVTAAALGPLAPLARWWMQENMEDTEDAG